MTDRDWLVFDALAGLFIAALLSLGVLIGRSTVDEPKPEPKCSAPAPNVR